MSKITVIDAHCGNGKTEYAIRYMNAHPDTPILYISPLLEMHDRIDSSTDRTFFRPELGNHCHTKLTALKEMVDVGLDILSTHALFLRFDNDIIERFKQRNYHLILDETLNAITVLPLSNKKGEHNEDVNFQELSEAVTGSDIKWLIEQEVIAVDEANFNKIVWIGASDEAGHRYYDLERLIKTGTLYYVDNSFLVWNFPIEALDAFDEVTILTYRFKDSVFRGYLDFWERTYNHLTVVREEDSLFLTDYSPEIENGSAYKELINIFQVERLNNIGNRHKGCKKYPLSVNWYSDKANRTAQETLRNHITNYLRHHCSACRASVMWTTYKSAANRIQPKGFVNRGNGQSCFVACTCRATEAHMETYNLAYVIDRHLHPGIVHFLSKKDISISNDGYALSELIQWVFRSRIRKGEPINIYIPSKRMRTVLENWLSCEQ